MIVQGPEITLDDVASAGGWVIKPQGACRADTCMPLPAGLDGPGFAKRLGMALVRDEPSGLISIGPESGGAVLASPELPDLRLKDHRGEEVNLRSFVGQRLVLTSWAPWCGCRMDLPVWGLLREELRKDGIEVITVALDSGGDSQKLLDEVAPAHPALIDESHQLVAALGFVNVPMAVWVDETGRIVRPAEPAWPGRAVWYEDSAQADVAQRLGGSGDDWVEEMLAQAASIETDADEYVASLRDWASNGSESPYVLAQHEVADRSGSRTPEMSEASARFELAKRLKDLGRVEDARAHLRAAHALDPENWSYKRQAWFDEDALQRPTEHYESDFVQDFRRVGGSGYYKPSAGTTDARP